MATIDCTLYSEDSDHDEDDGHLEDAGRLAWRSLFPAWGTTRKHHRRTHLPPLTPVALVFLAV